MNVFKLIAGLWILVMLVSACSKSDTLQIKKDTRGYHVNYAGVDRLTGLLPDSLLASTMPHGLAVKSSGDFVAVHLIPNVDQPMESSEVGAYFLDVPGFKHGVSFWRYTPWKAWTKPRLIHSPSEMEERDVQFMYWQYDDGLYAAAMPLSGHALEWPWVSDYNRAGRWKVWRQVFVLCSGAAS